MMGSGQLMQRYYDNRSRTLICCEKRADSEFWDEHWDVADFKQQVERAAENRFIPRTTRLFLEKGRVLEGGCGTGEKVYCLHRNGYDAFGVDYAQRTVQRINSLFPQLSVVSGDVRALPFDDNYFDGYWSLGVIEHFKEGFDPVVTEMKRVLRPGGFMFLTFPFMSPLRKCKAWLRLYKKKPPTVPPDMFYQYILDDESVKTRFAAYGFKLRYRKPLDGLKGFKDEVTAFKPVLQPLYDYTGSSRVVRRIKGVAQKVFSYFAAHIVLMVFQKETPVI